jgi:hypothetical protein
MSKLVIIKILHTAIWVFFNVILFYLFYSVINNGIWIGIIVMEGLILLIFKGMCPLTLVAQKYSDSAKDNFDIYLPNWLARYNKLIYSIFFGLIIILLIYRLVTN